MVFSIFFYLLLCCSNLPSIFPVRPANYACNKYPSEGTWLKDRPFWKEKNCPMQVFNLNDAVECFNGRKVYFMGISTGRQFAFSLYQILGGEDIDRMKQKEKCPSTSQIWAGS